MNALRVAVLILLMACASCARYQCRCLVRSAGDFGEPDSLVLGHGAELDTLRVWPLKEPRLVPPSDLQQQYGPEGSAPAMPDLRWEDISLGPGFSSRCSICGHWFYVHGIVARCAVYHPIGTCCHYGEVPIVGVWQDDAVLGLVR